MNTRLVITGIGCVSSIGNNLDETWASVKECKSGAAEIRKFDAKDFSVRFACEVKDYDVTSVISKRDARRLDPFVHYAVSSAEEALKMSQLDDYQGLEKDRVGVLIGTGIGGLTEMEQQYQRFVDKGPGQISPFLIPKLMGNAAAAQVALMHGYMGPNYGCMSACASGGHSIATAVRMMQLGEADVMVTGGTEATVTYLGVGGFASLKALSTRNDDPTKASRPFDKNRDGFVLGEGGGVIVLETLEHAKKRNAPILAEFLGYGDSCDAFHITQPDETGNGGAIAFERCLKTAGLAPEDVEYINAHGTSTPYNDKTESKIIRKVFKDHADKLVVSSTKSMTGHLLGGAAALEIVLCVKGLMEGVIPPTINYEEADPDCDLFYAPNEPLDKDFNVALSNSLGFGGHNVVLAVGKMRD